MKQIDKHEIFENLSSFLKTKGIELKEGSYSQGVQKACEILTDTVNLSQRGLERAATYRWDRTAEMTARVYQEVLGH